jgi:hypothetical protein
VEARAQSSAVAWLADRLAKLNPAAIDRPGVIEYHADQIRGHWLFWRWRGDNAAIRIRGKRRKRIMVKAGTAKELRRLLVVARGGSDKRMIAAWLGTTSRTHGLINWRPHGRGGFEICLLGFHAVVPTRADVLPLIEAALRKHEAVPADERRKRHRDSLADDVVHAVAAGYHDLTGQRGLFWDEVRGRYRGGLLDLGRDIEMHFGGAGLFTVGRFQKNFRGSREN